MPTIASRRTVLAFGLLAVLPAPAFAQKDQRGPEPRGDAPPPAAQPGGDDLQAAIAKSNAYTALMNRTLRAIQSWERYRSWVDMRRGPTGNERYISYGLYSLYDVTSEIAKAEEATDQQPRVPELDDTMRRYIAAYQRLAPLITQAERYYERKDYRDDAMALGRDLHRQMVPAAETFLEQRRILEARMREFKGDLDQRELTAIEAREGRSGRWQIRNIMINARAVMDLMPSNDQPVVDMPAFDRAIAQYAAAIREMDRFKETNPRGVSMIDSHASSWLGKLRDFREKLARSRGDVRRSGAGSDANWIVNDFNTMVTLSSTAMRMSR